MVWCRNLSRVLTVLGLCALGFAFSGAAMAAAPLCARVMMPEISAAEISATVASLAQMKLRLDLLQTESLNSQEHTLLSEQYPIKLAELQKTLSDKFSEKEIRRLLSTEIARQQGREKEHAAQEQAQRQVLRGIIPQYQLKKSITLSKFARRNQIEFLPEHKALIYENDQSGLGLMRLDINSGQETLLTGQMEQWRLLPDRRTLLVKSREKIISKVDVLSGEKKDVTKNYMMEWLSIDPNGEVLMLKGFGSLLFLDLNTGNARELPWKAKELPILLSKNEILVRVSRGTYIYNLETKSKQHFKVAANLDKFAFLSDNGQKFAFYSNYGKFEIFDLQNLSQAPLQKDLGFKDDESISLIKIIPGQPFFLSRRFNGTHREYEIFHSENIGEPLFTFPKYGTPNTEPNVFKSLDSFQFSPDGNDLAVLETTEVNRVRTYEVHIWKRK